MSEKKAKADRKLKVMTEEADPRSVAEDMAKSISKMYEDMDKRAGKAKDHLVSKLKVTVDKYRTASGVMSALATVREVIGNHNNTSLLEEEIAMAKTVATRMAGVTQDMATKAEDTAPVYMDKLCNDFYDPDFSQGDGSAMDMVEQLMILQLCQNVGPDASDITEFINTAESEIDKARANLHEYCDANDLNYLEVCGVRCATVLCDSCRKDCRDGDKIIVDGEFSYEICENFERVEE